MAIDIDKSTDDLIKKLAAEILKTTNTIHDDLMTEFTKNADFTLEELEFLKPIILQTVLEKVFEQHETD